jgi:proteasome accessory factor B
VAADQVERVTNLLALLLEARNPLTFQQLADVLGEFYPSSEASRRTAFERDKRLLRSQGVPLEQRVLSGNLAGQTGYWIDRDRYELPDLGLTEAETAAIQIAMSMVRTTDAVDALWKLGATAEVHVSPIVAELADLDALPLLTMAAAQRSTVSFRYRDSDRRLDPYTVASRQGLWYLIGFDHRYGELRTYRVDRIDGSIEVGPVGAFERPDGFDPRAVLPNDSRQLDLSEQGGADTAVVYVGPGSARAVRRELGAAAVLREHPDGAIDVAVPCRNPVSFRSWVLALDDAEVLSPPEVRNRIVTWLESLEPSV